MRPWRISLRWFLILTAATAALIGTVGKRVYDDWQMRRRMAEQARIETALAEARCGVVKLHGKIVEVQVSTPKALEWLKNENGLERLDAYCGLADGDVAHLANHRRLRRASIIGNGFTNASLATLGDLPELTDVTLSRVDITDDGLKHLSNLKKLESLYVCFTPIQGRGLDHLKSLPKLRHLSLNGSAISDDGLAGLAGCKNLESIDLCFTTVSDRGLAHLTALPKLKTIRLHRVALRSGEGLGDLDQVEMLDLSEAQLKPGVLKHLAEMKSLRDVNLLRSNVDDNLLSELKDVRQVKVINLIFTPVTDAGLHHLRGLKQLDSLNMRFTQVTRAGARELSDDLPKTTIHSGQGDSFGAKTYREQAWVEPRTGNARVVRFHAPIDHIAFATLAKEKELEVLSVQGPEFTDDLAAHLAGLGKLRSIEAIETDLSDDGLVHFGNMKELQSVVLRRSQVSGAGFQHLAGLPELTSITIDQSPVNDEGLEGLGQIASLQELSLRIVPLHGRGLGHLKGLTKIRHFTLISPSLKDVQGLEQLDQIETVHLAGRGLDSSHIQQFLGMENLRHLSIPFIGGKTLMELAELKKLDTLQLMVRTNDPVPEPAVMEDIRLLSAQMPDTGLTYRTYATGMSWGHFKGGSGWTPPPPANPGVPRPGGSIHIQAFFDLPAGDP
ncbi:MAG TPA: hypothetical protein VMP01_20940 [Pirellulaceae bacterium]|nr:hypothetical protein [Pirellulaceae bacterium]